MKSVFARCYAPSSPCLSAGAIAMRDDSRITFVAPRAGASRPSPATCRRVAGAFSLRFGWVITPAGVWPPLRVVAQSAPSHARRVLRSLSPNPSFGAPVAALRYASPPPRSSGARDIGSGGLRPRIFYRLARSVSMAGWRVPRRRRWLTAPAFCVRSLRRVRARRFYRPLSRCFAPFQK